MKAESIGKKLEFAINSLVQHDKKIQISTDPNFMPNQRSVVEKLIKEACEKRIKVYIIVEKKYKCSFCKKEVNVWKLLCEHNICKNCLYNIIKEASQGSFDDRIFTSKCSKCLTKLSGQSILEVFSYEDIAKLNLNAYKVRNEVNCQFCSGKLDITSAITLPDCDHSYHRKCLLDYISSFINSGKVTDQFICCLVESCKKPLGGAILNDLLTEELREKFIKYRLKFNYGTTSDYCKFCPECDVGIIISKDATIFKCLTPTCSRFQKDTCPGCDSLPAHVGKTCQEYIREKCDAREIARFEEVQRKRGSQKCPKCKTWVCKSEGCNCMKCIDPECNRENGPVYFCYICGTQTRVYHDAPHYGEYGYWGTKCIKTAPP